MKASLIYELIIDYGKPFTIFCNTKDALFNELLRLEEESKKEYPHFDIMILYNHKDLTIEILQEYNRKKEKIGFLK